MEYNRLEVGERLKQKRILMGLTQDEVAERINRSSKYYADIERGSCGMSIETLLALSDILDMSLDFIIYGKITDKEEMMKHTDEMYAMISVLNNATENRRKYGLRMLQLLYASWSSDE